MIVLAYPQGNPPVEIGKIYRDQDISIGSNGRVIGATFMVMREATRDEYLNQEQKPTNPIPHSSGLKYYLVSID